MRRLKELGIMLLLIEVIMTISFVVALPITIWQYHLPTEMIGKAFLLFLMVGAVTTVLVEFVFTPVIEFIINL